MIAILLATLLVACASPKAPVTGPPAGGGEPRPSEQTPSGGAGQPGGKDGAPAQQAPAPPTPPPSPATVHLAWPGPFGHAPLQTALMIRFSAPVDRQAAERALHIAPALAGRFEWPDGQTMLVRPNSPLTPNTTYEVQMAPVPLASDHARRTEPAPHPWRFTTAAREETVPLVRKASLNGGPFAAVTEFVGRPPAQLASFVDVASAGPFIYVLDAMNPAGGVGVYRSDGTFVRRLPTVEDLERGNDPSRVAAGADGSVYLVASAEKGSRLYRFNPSGKLTYKLHLAADIPSLAVAGNRLLLADRRSEKGRILILNAADGRELSSLPVPVHQDARSGPHGVAAGQDGAIWVLSGGRLYQYSSEGKLLWAIEEPPVFGRDQEGDGRLHWDGIGKTGPKYPDAMVPTTEGVWVFDLNWAKEFVPGKGMVRKQGHLDPFTRAAAHPDGGLLMGRMWELWRVQEGRRDPAVQAVSGGPGEWTHSTFAASLPGGFLLPGGPGALLFGENGTLRETRWGVSGTYSLAPDGRVWVHRWMEPVIRPFDGGPEVVLPNGILRIHPDNDGFVALTDRHLLFLGPDGAIRSQWPRPAIGGAFDARIAPLPDGRAAILGGPQVHLYDPSQGKVAIWGETGTGPSQLGLRHSFPADSGPEGIAATKDGILVIADTPNGALKAFTPEGTHLWTYAARSGPGALSAPTWVVADPKGYLWVGEGARVLRFTWR